MNKQERAQYMRERRKNIRLKILEQLGNKCSICGSSFDLEVNHVDRKQKVNSISRMYDYPWEVISEEIKKCNLLCKACHVSYTAKQWANGEIQPPNKGVRRQYEHGTLGMYNNRGCRCEECKIAKRKSR